MADTRINALSTATVSLSDDYLPIDGTTAGTKKLSAYSPSFGGNATVGGTLTVNGGIVSLASSSTALTSVSSSTSGATGYNQASFTLDSGGTPKTAVLGVQDTGAFFGSNTNHNVTIRTNLTDRITVSNAGVVSISSTSASTTTSSGALVVGNGTSGGLGVGGAIVMGGALTIDNVGADNKILLNRTGGKQWIVNVDASQFYVYNNTDAVNGLNISNAGNVTLAGSIRTSAPSGGTAANWKLGTVASVSPTSPNRTIEVDIGGTIYYIHAKTTNN